MLEALNCELTASHKLQLTKQTVSQAASRRAHRYLRKLMKPLPNQLCQQVNRQQVNRQQITHCSRTQVYLKEQAYPNRTTRISIASQ